MAKKTPDSITMRVRIGDSEIEVTGPVDFVERKIKEFVEKSPRSVGRKAEGRAVTETLPATPRGMSPAQFFKKVARKSDVDRVLLAGYFLEKMRGREQFTAADVKQLIKEARVPPPRNPNDSLNSNIRKGFAMTAGDQEGRIAFVLTSDGEEAVEDMLGQSRG